jgi:signal transduction histidine kinase
MMTHLVIVGDAETASAARAILRAAGMDPEVFIPEAATAQIGAAAVAEYRETLQRRAVAGTLAAGAAHDIANLVTALDAYIMHEPSGASDEVKATLARLRGVATSLTRFAVVRRERNVCDIAEIAEHAAVLVESVVRGTARIECATAPGEAMLVHASASQLSQVLVNLLLNAGQAIGRRGGDATEGCIELALVPVDGAVAIRVTDDGVGMTEHQLTNAFEPFFTTRGAGSGLGLYVCKQIAESYGGQVAIDSRLGVGTTVTVTLPRA